MEVLTEFRLRKSHIIVGGGGRSQVSASIDRAFTVRAAERFTTIVSPRGRSVATRLRRQPRVRIRARE